MLSHDNLASNALVLKDIGAGSEGDVLIHALPIYHVHGLFVALHGALLNGSTMLWHKGFDADAVIADMARATILMGVPTFYVRLAAHPRPDPRGRGRTCGCSSAARRRCSKSTFADVRGEDRPPHPRALRHDRGGDDLLQSL